MNDRFYFRGVVKLDTREIVLYSSCLKNYDNEIILTIEEWNVLDQIDSAGYELTDKDMEKLYEFSEKVGDFYRFNFSCESVNQCTGLRDKNNELIYEGDIVEFYGDNIRFVVEWNDKGFLQMIGDNDYYEFDEIYSQEVIICGNIHENKELLEVEKWL